MEQQPDIDGSLASWENTSELRNDLDELDLYVQHDDEFLYLLVNFRDRETFRQAEKFGFTVYFDARESLNRSFGITYPYGVVYGLRTVPGAREGFLQNPAWQARPENENLLQSVEQEMQDHALLAMRDDPDTELNPSMVSHPELQAHSLLLNMDHMTIEYRIPLETTRNRQFAIDPVDSESIRMGFVIDPPSFEEITGEREEMDQDILVDQRRDRRRGGRGGRRQQPQQEEEDEHVFLKQQLDYRFEKWVEVSLDPPED